MTIRLEDGCDYDPPFELGVDPSPVLSCLSITGVTEVEQMFKKAGTVKISDLLVYPVPATDLISVAFQLYSKSDIMMSITNINGMTAYKMYAQWYADIQRKFVGISLFPEGKYFLHINSEDQRIIKNLLS